MATDALADYVAGRVRAGVGRAAIREELQAVGWTEEEADAAYRTGLIAGGAPTPNERNRLTVVRKSSTVDIVINLFSFIVLGIIATALGTLFFQVINRFFPDTLDRTGFSLPGYDTGTIHYAVAALIISFPLYVLAMWLWFRAFREPARSDTRSVSGGDEGRTESKLSKWLTYLVLLVAAVTIVGDLIAVVFTLLQGEVTARFFLKALVILVIASGVFGFYFLERRKIQYRKDIPRTTFQSFGWGAAGLVALAIILGFVAGGSPGTERNRTFDMRRANDLNTLAGCISSYAQDLGLLPMSLADLKRSSQYAYCAGSLADPETSVPYEYRVVVPLRIQGPARVGDYELCALFALASDPTLGGRPGELTWEYHTAGRVCRTATTQLVGKVTPPLPPIPTNSVAPADQMK